MDVSPPSALAMGELERKSVMKLRAFMVLAVVAALSLFTDALAATYYIAQNGNDANPGTSISAPWRTIGKANSTLVAGDTVYIRAGSYAEQINPVNNGGSGKPITYARYSNEAVSISYFSNGLPQANLSGRSFIILDGLNFLNSGGSWIRADNSLHCIIQNCKLSGYANHWRGINGNNADYIKILNCTFADAPPCTNAPDGTCPADHVWLREGADYALVEGNTFGKIGHQNLNVGYPGNRNIIRNNIFENAYHTSVGLVYTGPENRNLFENNIVKNSGSDCVNNPDLSEACIPGSRFVNIFSHGGLQIGPGHNNIVRKNVFYNNGSMVFASTPSHSVENNKIYNNTFDQEQKTFLMQNGSADYAEFSKNTWKNNSISRAKIEGMFYNTSDRVRDIQFWVNNNFFGNASTSYNGTKRNDLGFLDGGTFHVLWRGQFSGNLSVDPKFLDWDKRNYSLQPNSPLIDAGAWLTHIVSPTGAGKSFYVAEAGYFCDGWGIVEGDLIQLQSALNPVIVKSINYTTNMITVDTEISWRSGDGVSLPYKGAGPDIGAFEYTGQSSRLAPPSGVMVQK